jgi:hypothetical protein
MRADAVNDALEFVERRECLGAARGLMERTSTSNPKPTGPKPT